MSDWPLVGRATEMERVRDLFSDEGRGGVVLAGPAGVGKTRLATECLAMAAATGAQTRRVTATGSANGVPFGAFGPVLPPTEQAGTDGTAEGMFGLLSQARRALVGLAGGSRLALMVDDAHLLDDASATLTQQLAASGAVFVITTMRSGVPAPDPLVSLWKDGAAERLDLRPLAPADVDSLIAAALDGPVDGATRHHLADRSKGNVQFLRELVLGSLDAGAMRQQDGIWRLVAPPAPSVRLVELVESRLRGLTGEERSVLETVAYGEPVGLGILRALADVGCLEALERRGLLSIARDGQRREARLAHPVHGDVLRARTPTLTADAVRSSLADAVERAGMRRRDDLLRVASWRLDGAGSMRPEIALAAADRAYYFGDFGLAERLSRSAVNAGGGFEAKLYLGWLLGASTQLEQAEQELSALRGLVDTDAQRGKLALARADNLYLGRGLGKEALAVLDQALGEVSDQEWRDAIDAKRAYILLRTGHLRPSLELASALIPRSRGRALTEACLVAATGYALTGQLGAAMAATVVNPPGPEKDAAFLPVSWFSHVHTRTRNDVLLWLGELARAEAEACVEYERAIVENRVKAQGAFAGALCRVFTAKGRIATAVKSGRESVLLRRTHYRLSPMQWSLADLAYALALHGDAKEAAAALAEHDAVPFPSDAPYSSEYERALAWTYAAQGNLSGARARLSDTAQRAAANGEYAVEARSLHDLVRLGHPAGAGRLEELLAVVEGDVVKAWASHASALADKDGKSLEAASAGLEALGFVLLAAEAAADAATVHRRAGDGRAALAAERLAVALSARCEGAATPALSSVSVRAALTNREREVALLAASGLSNRDITERVFLSVRTVENQLQRVYEKLGIRSRSQLAQALEQIGT